MIPRALWNRFVPAIRPLEKQLLHALAERLAPDARRLLEIQTAAINMVQRHTDCKEVCFYRMKWGKPTANPQQVFPLNSEEVKLATATIQVPGSSVSIRADFWLVRGFLFSITFDRSPKAYLKSTDIRAIDIRVHRNPMLGPRQVEYGKGEVRLSGWLAEWNSMHRLSNLRPPLAPEESQRIRADIGAALPPEYVEFVGQTEGATVGACRIYGLTEVRQVVLPNATYFVLAEVQDSGAIVVRAHATEALLYHCDYDDSTPSPIGTSFRAAVDRHLRRS